MKKLSSFIPILAIVFAIFTGNIALSASYSQELQEAYDFAYKNKITTQNSIDKADMYGGLTRIAMAKMLSQYAINILGKTPDTSKIPKFGDVNSKLDGDYNNGVTLAYQLGIMGVGIDKFRPYDSVTRAEFGTALSRVLYGDKYEGGSQYYTNHLNALKTAGIMNQINQPNQGEIRGYVMLMLMRSDNISKINCNDELIILACKSNSSECPQICTTTGNNKDDINNLDVSDTVDKPVVTNIVKSGNMIKVYYSDGTSLDSQDWGGYRYRLVAHNYKSTTDFELYCLVEFKDYDGAILKNDEIRGKGTEFSALGKPKVPIRQPDDRCIYTFSGWSNDSAISYDEKKVSVMVERYGGNLVNFVNWLNNGDDHLFLIENCIHKAQYICTPRMFTVTREGADGSILQQNRNLEYGDSVPKYEGKKPEKENYVFLGWLGGDWNFSVRKNIVYKAIFGDKGTEDTINNKIRCTNRQCSLEYSGTIFLQLPEEVIKDGWYFIGWDNRNDNSANTDKNTSNNPENDSSDDGLLNNSSSNNSSLNDNSSNNSSSNSSSSDNSSSNNDSSNDSSSNDENFPEDSGDSSNNSKNCIDIEVDDGNSYNFCIVKWKSNDSKFSVKVDNAKDLSLCTVGKGGQNYDFYNCEGDIATMGSSGISQLRLSIKYNNKTYSKKVDYDLTNGVFVD